MTDLRKNQSKNRSIKSKDKVYFQWSEKPQNNSWKDKIEIKLYKVIGPIFKIAVALHDLRAENL